MPPKKNKVLDDIKHKKDLKNGKSCVYCKCDCPLYLTIDHKTPKSRGGKDTDENKQVTCFTCNFLKGSLKDEEFKVYLKALIELKDLTKITPTFRRIKIDFFPERYPDFPHPTPKPTVVKKDDKP